MKNAVLAWGSLVEDPRDLQTAAKFAPDGPLLPIEFCSTCAGNFQVCLHIVSRLKLSLIFLLVLISTAACCDFRRFAFASFMYFKPIMQSSALELHKNACALTH